MRAESTNIIYLNWTHKEVSLTNAQTSFQFTASADECQKIAETLEVIACKHIKATYQITPLAQGRYRVSGKFHCIMEQACVISLEPLRSEISESFDVEFWPQEQIHSIAEIELEDLEIEDPEPIVAGCLEVGRLVYELITSCLDPYPRKKGEGMKITETCTSATQDNSPFAKLVALKH